MKITTQRTSKPLKLLMAAAVLTMLSSIVVAMSGSEAWLSVLAVGAVLWVIAKILIWFCHE